MNFTVLVGQKAPSEDPSVDQQSSGGFVFRGFLGEKPGSAASHHSVICVHLLVQQKTSKRTHLLRVYFTCTSYTAVQVIVIQLLLFSLKHLNDQIMF